MNGRENISRRKQNLVAYFSQRLRFEMLWIAIDVLISTTLVHFYMYGISTCMHQLDRFFNAFRLSFGRNHRLVFNSCYRKRNKIIVSQQIDHSTKLKLNEVLHSVDYITIDNYANRIKTMVKECLPRAIVKSCFMASILVPNLSFFRNDIVNFLAKLLSWLTSLAKVQIFHSSEICEWNSFALVLYFGAIFVFHFFRHENHFWFLDLSKYHISSEKGVEPFLINLN